MTAGLWQTAGAAVFNIANGDITALKSAINAANANVEDDTINLAQGGAYILTTIDNGVNGLPVIRTDNGHTVVINGNGATIMRSDAGGAPNFRIMEIGGFAVVTMHQVVVSNGHLAGPNDAGAGIHIDNGTLTMVDCTVKNNSINDSQPNNFAIAIGGGIAVEYGVLLLQNCTLNSNGASASSGNGSSAIARGGAITSRDGIVMLQNCTLTGNSTGASSTSSSGFGSPDASGAAIDNGGSPSGYASITISNCTFHSNTAINATNFFNLPGSGIGNSGTSATITFGNTIVSFTTIENFQGTIVSNGYNLSTDDAGGFFTGSADQINTDPKLTALANNGGPTQTLAVLPNSPAIDKGKRDAVPSLTVNTDQRGVARPFDFPDVLAAPGGDGSDIGAFEALPMPFIVTTTADHDDGTCSVADCTLREAILAANTHTGPDTIIFAPGVMGTINLTAGLPTLSTDLKITGPGANLLTVRRDTGGNYRIFLVSNLSNGSTPGPQVTIAGLTLANGQGIGSGAAGGCIDNDFATLSIEKCAILGNNGGIGAGVFNFRGVITVVESTISGNTSTGAGGAFYNSAAQGPATLTLINSTVSGNSASQGAAIHNPGTTGVASVTLQNCTLAGNSAALGGISNNGASASLVLQNTILSAGASGANIVNTNGATVTSQGNNLSSDAAGGDASTAPGGLLNHSGDKRNTNALLDPAGLRDNGGPTPTIALLAGSPAIDMGSNPLAPAIDQRAYLRVGTVDIGAFEFGGIPLRITSITLNGSNVVVAFNAVANRTFRLERKLAITDGDWQSISGVADLVPASDGAAQITHPGGLALGREFYRVRLVP